MKKGAKAKNTLLFMIFAAFLGTIVGTIIWTILRIMSLGIEFIWEYLPEHFENRMVYTIVVCVIGGLLLGIFQLKTKSQTEELSEIMNQLKEGKGYSYSNLHLKVVGAILPLIFGAAIGPEAGLTGVIVGLCFWVGDRLKYKREEIRRLAEAGVGATLSVVFNTPFLGLVASFESEEQSNEKNLKEKIFSHKVTKILKLIIYSVTIVSGFYTMKILGDIFGGGLGLPHFYPSSNITIEDYYFFLPLILIGVLVGTFYIFVNLVTNKISKKIKENRIWSCLIGGILLGVLGGIFPMTMFSGEHELTRMIEFWGTYSISFLIFIGMIKIVLTNICISFGWVGGMFFPLIFATSTIGYGMSQIFSVMPEFAVAIIVSSTLGYIMKKPIMVIGILLLCFPIVLIIPIGISSFISSKIGKIISKGKE